MLYCLLSLQWNTIGLGFNMSARCAYCGDYTIREGTPNRRRNICLKCHDKNQLYLGTLNKIRSLNYMGDKCQSCGHSFHYSAMDFHHIDPKKKDSKFKGHRSWSWEKLKTGIEVMYFVVC